jgi:hypothetical protein
MLPVCLLADPVLAHHGAFEYDLTTVLRYEGVVVRRVWRNPHDLTVIETRDPSGTPLTLEIEGGGPSGLRTRGVTKDSIVVGEHVIAVVNPSKQHPERMAFGIEIIKADGTVVPLGLGSNVSDAERPTGKATGIAGTWSPAFGVFMDMLRAHNAWQYTESGQERFDSYRPAMSSHSQCIPVSAPWLMVHPVVHEIVELEDRVIIRSDWMGAERVVYLDGRAHPPPSERFQQGHSVGRLEHGELVVDTTNFSDSIYAGVAFGAGKHLVERFSLSSDGTQLNYSFTLEDPEYLAEPVSESFSWNYRPDLQPSNVECDTTLAQRFLHNDQ